MQRTGLSVVVPSYERSRDLVNCLDALAAQDRPADQVIVIVRSEDTVTREVCERHPLDVEIVEVERPGIIAALNRGRTLATGALLAFTDDDARPRHDWLARIERHFLSDPRIGAVGGRDRIHHEGRIEEISVKRVGSVLWYGRQVGNHHAIAPRQDVQFLKGVNMSFRADALLPFEEGLRGMGAQVCNDLEASISVHGRGWRVVWDPEVLVEHYPADRPADDARNPRSRDKILAGQYNEL
jgi:cellulose synthase/poly-beta-1,6-N-acetylglucosamine synthase-like glycosyltransferase